MFTTFRNSGFQPLHTHCVCIVGRGTAIPGAHKGGGGQAYPMGRNQQIQALKIGNQMRSPAALHF